LAHGFLRGPLSCGYQRDGYGATKSGVVLTLFGFESGFPAVPTAETGHNASDPHGKHTFEYWM
jgi:hypothetical protein